MNDKKRFHFIVIELSPHSIQCCLSTHLQLSATIIVLTFLERIESPQFKLFRDLIGDVKSHIQANAKS